MRYNTCGQSTRADMASTVWKGQLSFGLVSIPVRLYRAARAEKISFRQLHRMGPVEDQAAEPETPAPIPIRSGRRSDIHEVERARRWEEFQGRSSWEKQTGVQ